MKLLDYLKQNKITQLDFAEIMGTYPRAVHRWVHHDCLPLPDMMVKIYITTKGQVTPSDFYDLPPLEDAP